MWFASLYNGMIMNKIAVNEGLYGIAAPAKTWWRGATIYQIYPRSFRDSNGDGIGDLRGIIEKIDYLSSLGIDGIWVSPFFTSPMKDFGYDVADYCGIDPMFGTMQDFDELIAKAHNKGLKVIIDQVYSHTSDKHEWFAQSRMDKTNPKADWYVWAEAKPDGSPPTNWQSVFVGSSWAWDARRRQYYLHNFLTEQPDLNLHNLEVQNAILEVARFWLDKGVDGFRLDALNFAMHDPLLRDNPPNLEAKNLTRPHDFQLHIYNQSHPDIIKFIERLAALINQYDGRFTVAEVGGANAEAEMRSFIEGESRLRTAYGFTYLYAENLTADLVKQTILQWPISGDNYWPSWAFSNHDAPRAISRWSKGRDEAAMAKMCLLLLASLRGNIFLYQGEELGLEQADVPFEKLVDPEAIANWPLTLGRDGARTPMAWESNAPNAGFGNNEPWLPLAEGHVQKAANAQENDPQSVLNWSRKVLEMRKTHAALALGDIEIIETEGELLAFKRHHEGQELLCVFNLGFEAINWQPLAEYAIICAVNEAELNSIPPMGGYWAKK